MSKTNICDHGVSIAITPCPLCLMAEIDGLKESLALARIEVRELRKAIADFIEVHNMAKDGKYNGSKAVIEQWNKRVDALSALLAPGKE